jgi:Domain of unknown function (DUF4338)
MDRDASNLLRALRRASLVVRRCTSKQELQRVLGRRSRARARRHRHWLRGHESAFLAAVTSGDHIDPARIRPVVQRVTSHEDRDLFRFARFTSTLPFSDRVGRRLRFLIRDASQPNAPLMGIAALGSPILDLRPRDAWMFNAGCDRRVKQWTLRRVAELYVAVGLEPYAQLLAGKLICYCMASRDVVTFYNAKYASSPREKLVALYTIGAFGTTASQYNRVGFNGRLLYRHIGVTDGWSVGHIPDEIISRIAAFLNDRQITIRNKLRRKTPSRLHIVHRFLRHVRIRPASVLYTGVHRGVYICPLTKNFRPGARCMARPVYDVPSLADAVLWWQRRWLQMRCQNEEVMRRVRAFRPERSYSVRAICGWLGPGEVE